MSEEIKERIFVYVKRYPGSKEFQERVAASGGLRYPKPGEVFVPDMSLNGPSIGYSRGPLKGIPIEDRKYYFMLDIDTNEEFEVDWEAEEADPREPFKMNNCFEVDKDGNRITDSKKK